MVVRNINPGEFSELDTKQRIMEVAIKLFALKGFDGVTIREIAKLAEVNVASLNYHFKSKDNLRQELLQYVTGEFQAKIRSVPKMKNASEYAVKIFETMTEDSARCLNQFKLILEADHHPCETQPYPIGFEQFSVYLETELDSKVPHEERLWAVHVIFSYIVHVSVMSSTTVGKKMVEKFLPKKKASLPAYIQELVESLIRDLNHRYVKTKELPY
jgi:AcrR family transcriptional regulator